MSAVHTELEGGVLRVVLDHGPANALSAPIVEGLRAASIELAEGPAKVAVVSSALDGFFAAGADIKHMATIDADGFAAYRDRLREPLERIASCGKPSIAAIDGLALGGGLELAMACTLRFATPGSKLGLPEVKLGLIPGAGGTQRLPRLVGRGRALDLVLSGRSIDGVEAERIGLVDQLVDADVVEAALVYADLLAGYSAYAMRTLIACADRAGSSFTMGMAFEGDAVVRTFEEGEAREGLAAFIEKRTASFA